MEKPIEKMNRGPTPSPLPHHYEEEEDFGKFDWAKARVSLDRT